MSPEVVIALATGDAIVGSRDGLVFRAFGARVSQIACHVGELRGLAHDPVRRRLLLVEHGATPARHRLHTLPLEP